LTEPDTANVTWSDIANVTPAFFRAGRRAGARGPREAREADKWTNGGLKGVWFSRHRGALNSCFGGYRVTDAHGRPLAYVYGVDGGARSALPEALTPAEARALAAAIARLPELMPSATPGEPEDG
jgi:hypothetical protein